MSSKKTKTSNVARNREVITTEREKLVAARQQILVLTTLLDAPSYAPLPGAYCIRFQGPVYGFPILGLLGN